ncbi:MAG: SulP family inorganic anion transporter [Planctomycetales bacterium]
MPRSTQADLLRRAGMLHLRQTEIDEQVHHLLTGLTQTEPAASAAAVESGSGPPEEYTAGQQQAMHSLRELAALQQGIVDDLEEMQEQIPTPQFDLALQACRESLADLLVGNFHVARASQDRATDSLADWRDSAKSHRWAAGLGILTIVALVAWQALFARRWRFLPAPLIAVSLVTLLSVGLNLPVLCVEVPDNLLEEVFLPSWAELQRMFSPGLLLVAAQIAVIASAETLLCATAVDQMHQGPRTRYDQELIAQGAGNIVCGFLSALPMTGVIVRSSANLQAGAKSRWSAVLHGVWMLLFVVGMAFLLRLIPTASLAAVLVYTGYKLVNPRTIKTLLVYGRSEAIIYVVTMLSIVFTDLLTGVLIGIGLSIAKLVYTFSSLQATLRLAPTADHYLLVLKGSATFLRLPKLAVVLDQVPARSTVQVNLDRLAYIDHACLELLGNFRTQHEAGGGKVIIDWNALLGRLRSGPGDQLSSSPPSAADGTVPASTPAVAPNSPQELRRRLGLSGRM